MPWRSLIHNGICTSEKYINQYGYILHKNKKININNDLEQALSIYLNSNHIKDTVYKENFIKSIKYLFPKEIRHIKSLSELTIPKLKIQPEIFKNKEFYKECTVNGKKEKLQRCSSEPAYIFVGKGNHPLRGSFKRSIKENDITLNTSKSNKIHGNWNEIICNPKFDWIASWRDPILNKTKYIYPSLTSKLNSINNNQKFDFARLLKKRLSKIRNSYNSDIENKTKNLECALCTYLIDRLLLRCGTDDSNELNDTYGCTTLLVKHITISKDTIKLKFRAKDSILCNKSLKSSSTIINQLKTLIQGKLNSDRIFNISHNQLNEYLNSLMTDLTAKVFRTCNASLKFDKLLNNSKTLEEYKSANLIVSKLCNHTNLNTSKGNYLDPRITVAFCKRNKININKCLSKQLQIKYNWALTTPSNFRF